MNHISNLSLQGDWQKLKKFNHALTGDGHGHQSFYARLTPSCQHYISNLNPINLFELRRPKKDLAPFEFAMVRDGLFSLFNFFMEHEKPNDIKTRLLIHENFLSFVPTAWQEQVQSYSFYYNDIKPFSLSQNEERFLIVKGILNDVVSPYGKFSLTEQITKLKEKNLQYKGAFFMPASKHSLFSNSTLEQVQLEQLLVETWEAIKGITNDVKIVSSEGVKRQVDFSQVDFLDLNPTGMMYMDDYTDLYLISRGAKPAFTGQRPHSKNDTRLEITPYHGITVTTPDFPTSQFEKLSQKIEQNKIEITQIDGYEFLKDVFHQTSATLTKWHWHE